MTFKRLSEFVFVDEQLPQQDGADDWIAYYPRCSFILPSGELKMSVSGRSRDGELWRGIRVVTHDHPMHSPWHDIISDGLRKGWPRPGRDLVTSALLQLGKAMRYLGPESQVREAMELLFLSEAVEDEVVVRASIRALLDPLLTEGEAENCRGGYWRLLELAARDLGWLDEAAEFHERFVSAVPRK